MVETQIPASAGELPLFWDVQAMHDIGAGLEMENWIEDSQPTNAEERLQVTPTHHCMQCSLCWNRAHHTGILELSQLGCACQQLFVCWAAAVNLGQVLAAPRSSR